MSGLFNRLQDEIEAREQQKGLSPIVLLDLPAALATVIQKIVRKNGMNLAEIAAELDQTPEETQAVLDELVQKGYVRRVEVKQEIWYKAYFGRKADKTLSANVWSALDSAIGQEEQSSTDNQ